jgi:hypothetical protein
MARLTPYPLLPKECTVSDFVKSLIRTWTPIGVGASLTWLATNYDLVIDDTASSSLVVGLAALLTALYYTLARAVEKAFPQLGAILVGLGVGKAPQYPAADGVRVRSGPAPYTRGSI